MDACEKHLVIIIITAILESLVELYSSLVLIDIFRFCATRAVHGNAASVSATEV